MSARTEKPALHPLLTASEELGVRLETAAGVTTWEALPLLRHQRAVKRILGSVEQRPGSGCNCVAYSDVAIRFPDGSFKRPDVAIWCAEPDEADEAVSLIPEAVVEVISPGYEKKDTDVGAPFYIAAGIKDVLLIDPHSGAVEHRRRDGVRHLVSPATVALECGCTCIV